MSSILGKTLLTTTIVGSVVMAGYLWKDENRSQVFDAAQGFAFEQPVQDETVKGAIALAALDSKQAAGTGELSTTELIAFSEPALAAIEVATAESATVAVSADDDIPAMAKVRMSRAVQQLAAASGTDNAMVEVIVAYNAADASETARIEGLGGRVAANFNNLPIRAISLPANKLVDLAQNGGVRVIDVDAPVQAASVSGRATSMIPARGSADYWEASSDVTVAVVDSGVAAHNDVTLLSSVACLNVSDWYLKFRNHGTSAGGCGSTAPGDAYGHGTHIAGSVGGTGALSGDMHRGVAPGAPIVSLKVLDDNGAGTTLNVIAALDWILDNKDAHNIRVVNLSLGKVVQESSEVDPLVLAAEALWDAGVVVVASAGNYGTYGEFTVVSPGNSRKLITVGALTTTGPATILQTTMLQPTPRAVPPLSIWYLSQICWLQEIDLLRRRRLLHT